MLKMDHIAMRFGELDVLHNIDFSVEKGEFVTLLGSSGSGKSTLLKLISGFLTPTAGKIFIDGQEVTQMPPESRDTALCFQSYALFPHLTVKENLEFGLRQKGMPSKARRERLEQVIEQIALEKQLNRLPNALSGGQQQRVALGRALVMRPKVILFDEPLSNLDAQLRDSVRAEIRHIQQENHLTAIYVTHDQSEALAMSDRVMVINAGRMEQLADPETLYFQPATSFVAEFIGGANFLTGTVIGKGAVSTSIGQFTYTTELAKTGETVRLCWRPEAIQFGKGEINNFSATVIQRAFQGSFTQYVLKCETSEFRVVSTDRHYRIGDQVDCHLPPQTIIPMDDLSS